jgi:hypothetical protein
MMNSNFDGGNGLYGVVQLGALAELGRLWDKQPKESVGQAWKRVVVVLAVVATPVALLLAGGLGS